MGYSWCYWRCCRLWCYWHCCRLWCYWHIWAGNTCNDCCAWMGCLTQIVHLCGVHNTHMGCPQVPPAHPDRLTDIQLNVVVAGDDDVHPVEHDEHNRTLGQEDVVSKPCPCVLHLQLASGLLTNPSRSQKLCCCSLETYQVCPAHAVVANDTMYVNLRRGNEAHGT